jgi:glycosyltransferase involved in cell wall biosynthesis
MRIQFIAGYDHPAYHRKVELLADEPDFDICHVTVTGYGRATGSYLSASGNRSYTLQAFAAHYLGRRGDPHRGFLWPPHYALPGRGAEIVHLESDVEALGTLQVALARRLWAADARLVGYSWQNIHRKRSLAVRLVSRLVLAAVDHMICASQQAAEVVRREGYRRGITVMPLSGVDTRFFHPADSAGTRARWGLEGFVVGFVGRLVTEKGLDLLLRAVATLPQAQALIVGAGPQAAALAEQAAALGLADRCRFLGALAYDAAADAMRAMDVLVLPSRTTPHWKEQFGRVLVEAMACDVPVVGAAAGAIPEVIGDAGLIFPENDATALAALLARLAANPALRVQLAAAGQARVQAHFTVERLAGRLADLWRDLAQGAHL